MPGLFDGTPLERPVTCEVCQRPLEECTCPRGESGEVLAPADQPARVRREKRRKGKTVTVIKGLDPYATDLKALCSRFQSECGAGGTVAGGQIEIQGDHRARVVAALKEMGYPAKVAGG